MLKQILWRFFGAMSLLLAGCASNPVLSLRPHIDPAENWQFTDLLYFDPHPTTNPEQDLVAVYARQSPDLLQIRLDFLEAPSEPARNLLLDIVFQETPGKNSAKSIPLLQRKYHLTIQSGYDPVIRDQNEQPVNDIYAEPVWLTNLDYAVIEIKPKEIPSLPPLRSISVQLLDPAMRPIEPPTPLIPNPPLSPFQKANLLMEFWDVMPGYTPAQTLRRWDGAHTGPFGQRHGLRYLLEAVEEYELPVILLDLNQPDSLAALNYLGEMKNVIDLANENLILLPGGMIGDPLSAAQGLRSNKKISQNYAIPTRPFIFAPLSPQTLSLNSLNSYQAAFAVIPGSPHLAHWQNLTLIPLPASYASPQLEESEIDRTGLTSDAKKRLVEVVLAGDAQTVTTFGGSLPASAWGDAQSVHQAFEYIQAHPWIHVLTAEDLLAFPVTQQHVFQGCEDLLCTPADFPIKGTATDGSVKSSALTYAELKNVLRQQLEALPQDEMTAHAWQMFFNLTKPSRLIDLQQLQANYLGQVGHLIAAIKWQYDPRALHNCSVDLDWDGEAECILATDSLFATFETNGARLIMLFSGDDTGFQQYIGPASQFAIGLSDPHDWKPLTGPASDPNEIPGAFSDLENTFQSFSTEVTENQVIFTATGGDLRKIFSLHANTLNVEVQSTRPITTRIPLLFDLQQRYSPEWIDCLESSPSTNSQICPAAPQVQVNAANIVRNSFADSRAWMALPENPSFGYPAGHYLPFPIDLLTVQGLETFSFEAPLPSD